jgi:hypothetical protein
MGITQPRHADTMAEAAIRDNRTTHRSQQAICRVGHGKTERWRRRRSGTDSR